MFTTYRYTKVRGPYSNQHPSISWQFHLYDKTLMFKFARCSPKDQFSYETARQILSERGWYQVKYNPKVSLVENAVDCLRGSRDSFQRRIVKDYEYIQRTNAEIDALDWALYT